MEIIEKRFSTNERGGATKNQKAMSIEKVAALTLEEVKTLLIKMTFRLLSRPSSDIILINTVLTSSRVSAAPFSIDTAELWEMHIFT